MSLRVFRLSAAFAVSVAVCLFSQSSHAQVKQAAELGRAETRITVPVKESARVEVPNSVHRKVATAQDLGRVDGGAATGALRLMLNASPKQEHDLQTLVDLQQDNSSSSFHKWLQPEEFGARFGASDADIAKLTAWLTKHGFTVDHVAKGKRAITFHGTVAQVESAFATEMHHIRVDGKDHVANTRPVSIPAAFSKVVAGVSRLNDFFPLQPHTPFAKATRDSDGKWHSEFTSGGGGYYMAPGDFATIYNTQPLLNAGQDGTGVTIGIVSWSEIPLTDVQTFRSLFGLKKNDPDLEIIGADQGIYYGGEGEAELDVEVSGAAAPAAKVLMATAPSTLTSDFLGSSLEYLVDSNRPDIISASVAECEAGTGTFLVPYYEQAAAQGISVFASSSDSGSDGCDDFDTAEYGTTGYGVNGWSSTPYNTSVGGTMFDEGNDAALYWNATNSSDYSSAKGYIPEAVWNESGNSANMDLGGIWAGSGGVSMLFARPSWQAGPGVPAEDPITVVSSVPGPHRSIPDVSLTAAVHDGYLTCFDDGDCQGNAGGSFGGADVSGGTSASSPAFAGIQALIDQKYGRQGVVNYTLYQLAAKETASDCNASSSPAGTCVFHDVTAGNNEVPCLGGTPDCAAASGVVGAYAEFPAGTAYDFASGLGSVNAANLSAKWNTVTFRSTQTELQLSTTNIAHGSAVTATAYVNPGAGTGTPTGDVSFYLYGAKGATKGFGFGTLSGNTATETVNSLPAGTYQVVARYAGDDTFGASYSNPVTITVTGEGSTTVSQSLGYDPNTYELVPQAAFAYGDYIYVSTTVAGKSGQGAPTGNVTLMEGSTTIATQQVLPAADSPVSSATSSDTLFTLSPAPGVAVGSHAYSTIYAGDPSFTGSTAATINITVSQGASTPVVSGNFNGTTATAGQTVTLMATIPALGPASPSGTVTFYNGSTAIGSAVTLTAGAASTIFTPSAAGTASITARYSGDSNYLAETSAAFTFTVVAASGAKTTTVLAAIAPAAYGTDSTLTATVTGTGSPTGTVDFYSSGTYLGSATLSSGVATLTLDLPAGTDPVQAIYRGNTGNAGSKSAKQSVTVTKNSPTVAITASPLAVQLGQSIALTAYIPLPATADQTTYAPSGTVSFYDGTTLISTQPILGVSLYGDSYARAEYKLKTSVAHSVTAHYNGDANYDAEVSAAASVTVAATIQTVTTFYVTPYPVTYGQTAALHINVARVGRTGTPTGKVTLYANGAAVLTETLSGGSFSVPIDTVGLATGKYLLYVVYAGDASDAPSTSEEQTVALRGKAATATALSASPSDPTEGQTVMLTATVAEKNTAALVPTGTVKFSSGTVVLGSAALNSSGVATLSHSSSGITPGTYSVTATYSGDTLHAASSATIKVTVKGPS